MHGFETSKIVVPQSGRCQDQVAVKEFDSGIVIVIADGAGGSGNGDIASRAVTAEVEAAASMDHDAEAWCQLLRQVDQRIPAGESTCVVFSVSTNGVVGPSVGDSQLWQLQDAKIRNLTESQVRKPLLGSGDATPVAFTHPETTGILLASTDGFSNYVRKERLLREYLWHEFALLPRGSSKWCDYHLVNFGMILVSSSAGVGWQSEESRGILWTTKSKVEEKAEQKNPPELPIGRFLKSKLLGGNRVIFGVIC